MVQDLTLDDAAIYVRTAAGQREVLGDPPHSLDRSPSPFLPLVNGCTPVRRLLDLAPDLTDAASTIQGLVTRGLIAPAS